MKGASAELSMKMMNMLNRMSITTMGSSQNFFLILKKVQNSFKINKFPIKPPKILERFYVLN